MRIARTLAALAVVALLLNGCGRSKDLTGGETPSPTPTPNPTSTPKATLDTSGILPK